MCRLRREMAGDIRTLKSDVKPTQGIMDLPTHRNAPYPPAIQKRAANMRAPFFASINHKVIF